MKRSQKIHYKKEKAALAKIYMKKDDEVLSV